MKYKRCLLSLCFVAVSCGQAENHSLSTATEIRVDPASATLPIEDSPAIPSGQEAATGSLTDRVEAAYYALLPSIATQVGLNVIGNREIQTAIAPCVKKAGFDFHKFELVIDSKAISEAMKAGKNYTGVQAAWENPPDPAGATNGLGLAGGPPPAGADAAEGVAPADPEETYGMTADEVERYNTVVSECMDQVGEIVPFDRTLREDILVKFSAIGVATSTDPRFEPIRTMYVECVKSKGFNFTDPSQILDIAKDSYGKLGARDGSKLERAIAVVDAECRTPIYSDILNIHADEWEKWLNDSSDGISKIQASFAEMAAKVAG